MGPAPFRGTTASQEPEHRERLWRHVRRLSAALGLEPRSPILPLIVGTEQAALQAGEALWRAGFHVPAIRPPTVPKGTSRLRISLSAAHSDEDVTALIQALQGLGLCPGTGAGPQPVSRL